ncbi:MAG: cation:proton antiporter, partial [Rhodobacteraceae bacterium]|nr:cation:proton antiporter [Paracoccaceae bacterium]
MTIIVVVAAIAALFLLIALSEPLAERLRLPFTVLLATFGTALGIAAVALAGGALGVQIDPGFAALLEVPIRANAFLYIFLPTLLFQVALGLNLRRLFDDAVPVLLMAVLAVVVATLAVGFALAPFTTLPLAACLLVGAIVSTTDPSAVVGIFRSIQAPARLTRIVEGESLLNDAAAIALFGLFLTIVMAGVPDPTWGEALGRFPVLLLGGAALGWVVARAGLALIAFLPRHPMAQVTLSVALPYITYIAAERGLGVSGVVAVVVAGGTLNLLGPGRMTPASWSYLREVWDILAHWAGALVFVLAALLIPRLLGDLQLSDMVGIAVVTVAAVAARAIVLWGVLPALSRVRLSTPVEGPYRVALLWGGLRGAVTLALALAVTESAAVPPEIKREVGILATGFTLFTLLVQGTTLRWMIARLGLDRLSPLDQALANQVIALALQNVREEVGERARGHGLEREIVRGEAKRFGERLEAAREQAREAEEVLDRDRVTLGLVALAGRERDMIIEGFRAQLISSRLVERMLSDADRLIERTRAGGRAEYRASARRALGRDGWTRLALVLHNRLGLSGPLARITADRFEILLTQRLILRDLHSHISDKIRRIHGKRVSDLLQELLRRREAQQDAALEGLRLQFPGYAGELERRYLRRTALRLEEREYDALLADGLIGRELHARLLRRIARERAAVERRPRLDLAVARGELIAQVPLFADLDAGTRKRLARALVGRSAAPGEVLLRRGENPRQVTFIASGAAEVETAGQKQRIGRGDMFGQLVMLAPRRMRTQVTAIGHCALLTLDEDRFLRLLRDSPALQEAVLES